MFPFSPGLAETLLGKSFVVCVVGGLGTVPGALAGGLALGSSRVFSASGSDRRTRPSSSLLDAAGSSVSAYRTGWTARDLNDGSHATAPRSASASSSSASALLRLALTPWLGGNYLVRFTTSMSLFVTMALSWNFIGGYAGYPSFATAAFFGLGAYAGAIAADRGPGDAGRVAVRCRVHRNLRGIASASAILRLRGHYFAVGSFAVVEILRLGASSWHGLTGGGTGLNVPILPGGPDFASRDIPLRHAGACLVTFAAAVWVDRSSLGFGLRCIRQNESAANMLGIDVDRLKIVAFVLSATSWAPAARSTRHGCPTSIRPILSRILMTIKVPVMVLLGGAGNIVWSDHRGR